VLVPLILAAILDLALAGFLVAVSGFIFGGGPEGANGETTAVVLWVVGLAGCFAAPAAGFVLRSSGRAGWGVLAALIPPVVGALFMGI
jgi:hypothetical protein